MIQRIRIPVTLALLLGLGLLMPARVLAGPFEPFVRMEAEDENGSWLVGLRTGLGTAPADGASGSSLAARLNAANMGGRGDGLQPMELGLIVAGVVVVGILVAVALDDDDDGDEPDGPTGPVRWVTPDTENTAPSSTTGTSTQTAENSGATESTETTTTTVVDGNTTTTHTTTVSTSSSYSNR